MKNKKLRELIAQQLQQENPAHAMKTQEGVEFIPEELAEKIAGGANNGCSCSNSGCSC